MPRESKLRIADIVLSVVSDERAWRFPPDTVYHRFVTDDVNRAIDASIRVHWGKVPVYDFGEEVFTARHPDFTDPVARLYRKGRQRVVQVGMLPSEVRSQKLGVFDERFRSGDVYVTILQEPPNAYPYPLGFPLDRILLLNILGLGRGIMVHACGINCDGQGFLFIGPSHSGKTTLARLWKDYRDVTVLSDECLIIRRIDSKYQVYGTPWPGRDKFASPESAPVEKIFFIRHADKNVISSKKEIDTVENLLAQSFSSFYDRAAMQHTLDFCSELAQKVPAYDLGFVPTQEIIHFVQGVK